VAKSLNLPPQTLYDFIVGDFEVAWNAVAAVPAIVKTGHRGNFMFARQAMTLLEFAARLCTSDTSGAGLRALSEEIEKIEHRYFTPLPSVCMNVGRDFELPSSPTKGPREQQLLWALFDLIRNGQAHQYQQINVSLPDGKQFKIGLSGAQYGLTLNRSFAGGRPDQHLAFRLAPEGVGLDILTNILFLDIREAVSRANLLARGLTFSYLERPHRGGPRHYNFDSGSLKAALRAGGHGRLLKDGRIVP
jgi:hypothetical protein